mmetsp:Transcript_31336/g.78646  ORF Transcript_31336/g.78646 Transcript_31336/m.78646 type:complete len:252 (+) Transcript_31336:806-1561(+)
MRRLAELVNKPRQRLRRRVAASKKEVDDDVPEPFAGAVSRGQLPLPHAACLQDEARQQVGLLLQRRVAERKFAVQQRPHKVVDHADVTAVLTLASHVEKALDLPCDVGEAVECQTVGGIERLRKPRTGTRLLDAPQVLPKRDGADGVQREAAHQVLHVNGLAACGCSIQHTHDTLGVVHKHAHHEGAEAADRELVAGGLPLKFPHVPIRVENAVPQQLLELAAPMGSLREVLPVSLENVFYVLRVIDVHSF